MHTLLKKYDLLIQKVVTWLLVLCVAGMLGFSTLNIIVRWFGHSFLWVEPLVRHLVFFSAFLGGAMATAKGNHIGIDILGKALEGRGAKDIQSHLQIFLNLVCFVIIIFLFKSSYDFTQIEFKFGQTVFWGIHSGWLVSIIPFGFALLAERFLVRALLLSLCRLQGEAND